MSHIKSVNRDLFYRKKRVLSFSSGQAWRRARCIVICISLAWPPPLRWLTEQKKTKSLSKPARSAIQRIFAVMRQRLQVDEEPPYGCATSKSLFIYFIYLSYAFPSFYKDTESLQSKTPLCNRPSEIYIFTGFSEKTSLGWLIFQWVFLLSCVLLIKTERGGRPYIFTGMKILNTFYILL